MGLVGTPFPLWISRVRARSVCVRAQAGVRVGVCLRARKSTGFVQKLRTVH